MMDGACDSAKSAHHGLHACREHFLESLIRLGCNNLYFFYHEALVSKISIATTMKPKLSFNEKERRDHHFETNRLVRLVILWSNEIVCQGQTHLIIRVRSKACFSIQNLSQHLDQCGVV
jgi:hypothetical protein